MMLTRRVSDEIRIHDDLTVRLPDGGRVLIVCADVSITEQLRTVLREEGFILETAKSFVTACELARSGRFQAVVSAPLLADGSWRRLIDIAKHYELGFEVILLGRTFDLLQWTEALKDGAFDVLDALCDLPRAAGTVKRAIWAAYLKGAWPRPEAVSH